MHSGCDLSGVIVHALRIKIGGVNDLDADADSVVIAVPIRASRSRPLQPLSIVSQPKEATTISTVPRLPNDSAGWGARCA